MSENYQDFPFEEIRNSDGNYFSTIAECEAAGFTLDQIWSVVESDGSYSYGPSHHFINLLGYICTKETHDGKTYYHEQAEEINYDDLAEALGLAEVAFGENSTKETAGKYLAALMDAENEGIVDDEDFRDHLVEIRDWFLAE